MTEEKRALARLAGVLGAFLAAKLLNYQGNIGIFINFVGLIVILYILTKRRQVKIQKDRADK
ncbi:hypothetical protein ACDJ35_03780 [Enterococcus faecalis]|uniref:hypothetical protein n=1 Tax=Enterococcus faecalis TaxID=1351 RepID=UPI003F617285